MVTAILKGTKTSTRRIIKPYPDENFSYPLGFIVDSTERNNIGKFGFGVNECGGTIHFVKPPYKQGDILYVKETWNEWTGGYVYKAWPGPFPQAGAFQKMSWKPSIHMPKEAARIFLKVTDVRVERLRDITNEQALKEGAEGIRCTHAGLGAYGCTDCMNTGWIEPPLLHFMDIWDDTIDKKQIGTYGWDANPWVWVIDFEQIPIE